MAEVNFFEGEDPVPVPAQTVFAVLKMIINGRKGSEFEDSLTKDDVVSISPELINKAKSFIDANNVAPRASLRMNILKCRTVTPPHRTGE